MEIMGQKLDLAFKELGINAAKIHETPGSGTSSPYQVWGLSESEYEKLSKVSEAQWKDEYGWYRTGRCIYEGSANVEYVVNNEKMMGYESSHYRTTFKNYSEWMEGAMNLTKNTNVVIFAESLAQDNGLSLAGFMKKYQG